MKKKLYEYLRSLGFVRTSMSDLYFAFTIGGTRQCLAIPKGKLGIANKLHVKARLVSWGYITETDFDNQFMYVKPDKRIFMRELMLKRLWEFKKNNENFSPELMRWRNFKVNVKGEDTLITKVNFDVLEDEDLLSVFEAMMRRLSKVM